MSTKDMLQEHIGKPAKRIAGTCYFSKDLAQRITCKDGTALSVQASEYHYCEPRTNEGPYYTVEVGFPSIAPPETWMEYCEDSDKPTETVYGYIPTSLVVAFIDEHGGIDFEAMNEKRQKSTGEGA